MSGGDLMTDKPERKIDRFRLAFQNGSLAWGACALVVCVLISDVIGVTTGHWSPHIADAVLVLGGGIIAGILLRLARRP
jgi:hypothetical protein